MSGSDIFVVVISSAFVGAVVSSVTVAFTQWRERIAHRENMLLTVAVDLAKVYVGRIAALPGNALSMEMAMIPEFQGMLKEIIRTNGLSKKHCDALTNYMDVEKMIAAADARKANQPQRAPHQSEGGNRG